MWAQRWLALNLFFHSSLKTKLVSPTQSFCKIALLQHTRHLCTPPFPPAELKGWTSEMDCRVCTQSSICCDVCQISRRSSRPSRLFGVSLQATCSSIHGRLADSDYASFSLDSKLSHSVQNSSMIAASITDWFTSNGYDAVAANGNLIGTWARVG
jgi:hypothetical protein